MGLLDAFKQYVKDTLPGGLLNAEWTPQNVRTAGEAMSMIPNPMGDVASGLLAVDDLRKGDYGDAALNFIGVLPFIPAMSGVIKEVGKMPKKGIYPPSIDPSSLTKEMPKMFGTGMSGSIKKLTNGDFFGRYIPAWMGEGKPFYAIGDNADELKEFMLNRMVRSERGTSSAQTKRFNQSLLGQLQKAGYSADDFIPAHSTQSASEYYTHGPSGTKIRISDHDLPLHYEQPDVDLRSWMTMDEKLQAIKKALGE